MLVQGLKSSILIYWDLVPVEILETLQSYRSLPVYVGILILKEQQNGFMLIKNMTSTASTLFPCIEATSKSRLLAKGFQGPKV